jgi:NB-ARC domain
MTQLDNFKESLLENLNEGYQAVPLVLSKIEASGYDYHKPDFADLRNDAYTKGTATDPSSFIVRLQVFIGTLSGIYRKKLRYNIPYRPDYFVGREKKLVEIHERLTGINSERQNILLLSGIGGMGKTTLMQEYLYQDNCLEYFNGIVVISVNKNLQSAFLTGVAAALAIDLKNYPQQEKQIEVVLEAMRQADGNNLLVVDNINAEDFDDLVAIKSQFTKAGWKVLITTRTEPNGFSILRVDELDIVEATFLFTHHYVPEQVDNYNKEAMLEYIKKADLQESIDKLLVHITKHTLLTELLAKFGKKRGLDVADLYELLKKEDFRNKDLQTMVEIGPHAGSTFREEQKRQKIHQYLLGLFETEYLINKTGDKEKDEENAAKATMLHFFSVLPSDDAPIGDLKTLWRVDKSTEIIFEDRLDELKQIGWIQGKQQLFYTASSQNLFYKMHPLVQEVVYEKLKPDINTCRPLVITITEILSQPLTFPQAYQYYAKSVIDKLNMLSVK